MYRNLKLPMDEVKYYLEALEQVRAGLRDPEDVEAERDDIPGFASVFEQYRERLYRRGRVDLCRLWLRGGTVRRGDAGAGGQSEGGGHPLLPVRLLQRTPYPMEQG